MRVLLSLAVLCGFAIGIASWSARSGWAQSATNSIHGSLADKTEVNHALKLSRGGSSITVSLSPVHAGVTVKQPLHLTASVANDSSHSGVTWSSSGGVLTSKTATSASFSATEAGVYTITASSKADDTRNAAATVGVTDLAGVATWRNDLAHSGVNPREYALTSNDVASNMFGKLFSCPVDGWVYAQPLWVANLKVRGVRHNVVFIATENDSLYAFDADGPGCKVVWPTPSVNLIPSGEKIAPLSDLEHDSFALGPVTGITGTPVIDLSSQTIYLVAVSETVNTKAIVQRLHAIDITTGQERPRSPVLIASSLRGKGYDNVGGTVTFAPKMQKQRAGLLLLNGIVYVCWGGYNNTDFYHGWLMGYDASTLVQVRVLNDTVDGGRGGIWMSGASPIADSQGNIYLLTGNGDFNANTPGGRNYGDTVLKLATSGGLSVADWFTPFDQSKLAEQDLDLGTGGGAILPDQARGPFPHLLLGCSKSGTLYVLNRDNLGHYNSQSDAQIVQSFAADTNEVYATPLFWQNVLYVTGDVGPLKAFRFLSDKGQFETQPFSTSSQRSVYPGVVPVVSAAGSDHAILWAINPAAPAVLHAYDPSDLNKEFWNSSQATSNRDQAGPGVKFTVPTVANGRVYVGTQTELDVYGLLPN